MATGYEDIENLTSQKQNMLNEALNRQNDIVNQQTQMNVDELERQKQDIEKNAIQTNKALYQQYRKASDPFGVRAENLASQGLKNSGYAETTQARLYNTYQQNITNTLNSARELKSNVDFQIQQAIKTGNITLAQNALELYKQQMELLTEDYELRNNREQFLYQKEQDALAQRNWQTEFDYQKQQNDRNYNYQVSRDKVADNQWLQNFNYQKSRDTISDRQWQTTFDYQKSRDKVSDSQWQKEYELSKKASASSSKKSSTKKSSSKTTSSINIDDGKKKNSAVPTKKNGSEYTAKEVMDNVKIIQGPGVANPIKDGISGKTFKSVDALLNYYGYVGIND